jgi:hypothetical protein
MKDTSNERLTKIQLNPAVSHKNGRTESEKRRRRRAVEFGVDGGVIENMKEKKKRRLIVVDMKRK